MRLRNFRQLFLLAVVIFQSTAAFAFETDQYNLPPQPLADIGAEVTEYTQTVLQKSLEKVNAEIINRENCLKNQTKQCDSAEKNKKRLAYLRSNDAVAHEVYEILGGGIVPFTNSGTWLEKHDFQAKPARFKPSFNDSLFVHYPISYIGIASTIKMFDSQFGTDKIAHLFQEGYGYFKTYNNAVNKGLSANEATQKAIKSGQKSEHGIYGTFISGVFSNGDLAANYVGMKFYQGFTEEIRIGEKTRPAMLRLQNGIWVYNETFEMREMLLKPFISNHLNEALNPSSFTKLFGLHSYIRDLLKNHACSNWKTQYPNLSKTDYEQTTNSLKRWNNEDYGFTENKDFITIANTCF